MSEIKELQLEVKRLHRIMRKLAKAMYTHTRTDIRPDAALPAMMRLVAELEE